MTAQEVEANGLAAQLSAHIRAVIPNAVEVRTFRWLVGASVKALPDLQIIRVLERSSPSRWHYVTAGASELRDGEGYGLEFCFQSPTDDSAHIELLAMVAYMHSLPNHRLGPGHTLNIGRPVVSGSSIDRLLVSLPFPYGEEFEFVHSGFSHIRMLWLLPIHASEEVACHEAGLDVLEECFEEKGIDFLDFSRPPVV